jgi:diguanylate cyclase (GGDEF)-like protein/PAS domain S-box-containing protein
MDASQRHLLDAVPVGLQIWEATGDDPRSLTLRYANPEASREAGFDIAGCAGQTVLEIFPATVFSSVSLHAVAVAQRAETLEFAYAGDDRLPQTWWRFQATPIGGRSVLAAVWNITEAKQAERKLRESLRLGRSILAHLQEGVVVVDTDTRVVTANAAAAELLGMEQDDLVGRPLSGVPVDLLDDKGRLLGPDRLPLYRALRGDEVRECVVRFVRDDGSLLWVEINANPLVDDDGRLYGAVASYDDVTVRVERDRRTRHEADHDPLTGLANRRALERGLAAAVSRAGPLERSVGVLMLDLDGFKAVNDRHGHAAGDEALREVARRLRRCVRERDLVARLGGDEFVVVLTDLGGDSGAAHDTVERVRSALGAPIAVDGGVTVGLRAAVGVAVFPTDGDTVADLLAVADRGMYAAKASGTLR